MSYTEIASISLALVIAVVFIFFLTRKNTVRKPKKTNISVVNALAAFFNGDDNTAIEKLKDIAFKGGANPEIYLILGFLFRRKGDFTRAAQIHEMMLGNSELDKDFRNALIGELAEDYMLAGQYAKAVSLLQNEHQVMNNPDNIVTMAKSALFSQSYDNALQYHIKYNKITGKYLPGFFEKCMVEKAVNAANPQASFKHIKSALEENKQCRPARIIKGILFLKTDKVQKAVDEFQQVIEEGLLRDMNDIKNVEKAYIAAGKEGELTALLRKQASLGALNPFIHIALAEKYEYNDEKENAKTILESYIEQPDAKIIAAKIYAEKFNNKFIGHIVKDVYSFKCRNCGFETNQYKDDCPKCSAYDSIYPK